MKRIFTLFKRKQNPQKLEINLEDIVIDVIYKNIKNIHLRVHSPSGKVRITSPKRISLDTLHAFAMSKLTWIKKHQHKIQLQQSKTKREYITHETHYFLGEKYLLDVIVTKSTQKAILNNSNIELYVREHASVSQRRQVLNGWYRDRLKEIIPEYIQRWEKIMQVHVNEFGIKRMKTRWGTCNTKAQRIWINLELAKKPIHCLEYIIVHEMVHLLERSHNKRFSALMDEFLPKWKVYKQELNRFSLHNDESGC